MKKTDKLLKDWADVEFVSSSAKTEQFKKFARALKATIKEQVNEDFEVISYSVGHFYVSGFLQSKEHNDQFVYFSLSDVRGPEGRWAKEILIRTAKHEKDYTGGHNNYTSLQSFGEKAIRLLKVGV